MEPIIIHRRGSFFYIRSYYGIVLALSAVYAVIGAVMAVVAANAFDSRIAGYLVMFIVGAVIVAMWGFYLFVVWVFERESRQSVEVTDRGIREMHAGREHAFIPWGGVREIELAATIVAGASLRLKGNFSEISISNVDLAITGPMRLAAMHRALGQTSRLHDVLLQIRSRAPQAALKMNRLARRRLKKYAWAELLQQ